MKRLLPLAVVLALTACGGQQQTSVDKQIAENEKKIELLKQEAEIQRLQNQMAQGAQNVASAGAQAASAANQVYQLAASEVANTIPQNLQEQAKATGQAITGTDGQQYMYDAETGNWLLYGALGAAAGYLAANAMNNRNAAKYTPVQKPTAAVERVYKDYQAKNPSQIPAPKAAANTSNNKPFVSAATPQNQPQSNATKPTPNYRPAQVSPSRSIGGGLGGRRKR